jgi:hypothetical protein
VFRKELQANLKKIFDLKKVTFDAIGKHQADGSGVYEQDCLFIEIAECFSRVTKGHAYAKVTGSLIIFCQRDELPYGFFNKQISKAPIEAVKNFFFFDVDVDVANSPARLQNISERRARFVYLYSAQHDPNQGSLESLDIL